jgi:hypothetical protein
MNSRRLGDDYRHSATRSLQFVICNGEYAGYTAPDKIDPQHRADHQSNANGGCLQDAQSAAARAGGTALCRFDE